MDSKRCPRCGATKPVSDYYLNKARRDGLSPYCVECSREATRQSLAALKQRAVDHLGGCCQRCGFADIRALQIDHVKGGGNRRRREGELAGPQTYRRVLADEAGEYQLLCANCNWIKRHEDGEMLGNRDYGRVPPTERRVLTPEEAEQFRAAANARRGSTLRDRTRERDDRIVASFGTGMKKRVIAEAEGMTYGAVHAVLKKRGLIG